MTDYEKQPQQEAENEIRSGGSGLEEETEQEQRPCPSDVQEPQPYGSTYPPNEQGQPPYTGTYPPNGQGQPPYGGMYPPNGQGQPPYGGMYPPGGQGQPPYGGMYPPNGQGQPPYSDTSSQNWQGQPPYGSMYPPNGPEPPYGTPYWQNGPQPSFEGPKPPKERNRFAVVSLMAGLCGLLSLCCFAFPLAIVMGVGAIAFAVISKKGQPFSGPAIAGIVLGALCILFGIGEFIYIMVISALMKDPENAALFNQLYEQMEQSLR